MLNKSVALSWKKCYLDNGAIRFLDKRTLKFGPGGKNYLTGRWVLTVKVDKDGNFTNLRLDGSVGVFRISMAGSNKLILPLQHGMVSVLSVSRLPVLCGICCIWILKLRSFRGNTTIYRAGLSSFSFLVT